MPPVRLSYRHYKTQHIYLLIGGPSDQEKPLRWKNHPAEEWVLCIAMIPNASTSSVRPRLCALCSYSCVYLLVLLLIFGWLSHHCTFPELGPFTELSNPEDQGYPFSLKVVISSFNSVGGEMAVCTHWSWGAHGLGVGSANNAVAYMVYAHI